MFYWIGGLWWGELFWDLGLEFFGGWFGGGTLWVCFYWSLFCLVWGFCFLGFCFGVELGGDYLFGFGVCILGKGRIW